MTAELIRKQIRKGEDISTGFKVDANDLESIAKTVCAFLNTFARWDGMVPHPASRINSHPRYRSVWKECVCERLLKTAFLNREPLDC